MKALPPHDVLVSAGWLEDHLRDTNVRVIDVRWSPEDADWGKRAYTRGHVPGAVYLGSREQMATPDEFCPSMEAAGVSHETTVIVHDDGGPFHAARLVWRLHYFGHRPAYVLDGGFRKWLREGRPVETRVVAHPRGRFIPSINAALRKTKDDVLRILSDRDVQIVDCRRERSWNAGRMHIPGARHLPSSAAFTSEGTWKPGDDQRRVATDAGVELHKPIVLYCGGGVSASCVYLMLKMLDAEEVAVYDASWREWGSDPELPKEPH